MQRIFNTDFTKPLNQFKTFDSSEYQFTKNGLVLTSHLDPDLGTAQPARFRAFGLPLSINEYAESTIKIPDSTNGNGLDFSFWYYNTRHKYGYIDGVSLPYDDTEFDVDEVHNNTHSMSLYSFEHGNTFIEPKCSDHFAEKLHTFAIKWTNSDITYLIDNNVIFHKDIHIDEPSMFPTWEIEVPGDGLSSMWLGAIDPKDFPAQAIVKNYSVYKL